MGRLAELNAQIDALNDRKAGKPKQQEIDMGVYVEAITSALVDLTERLEGAAKANEPIAPKDYSRSIGEIAKAISNISIDAGVFTELVDAIKSIEIPAPVVNVPEIEIERAGPMCFDIERSKDGFIQRVIARPYEPEPLKGNTYDME